MRPASHEPNVEDPRNRVDPADQYPMAWSLECTTEVEYSSRTARRRRSWRHDEEVSMLDRWLREFADDRGGASCPPPMS